MTRGRNQVGGEVQGRMAGALRMQGEGRATRVWAGRLGWWAVGTEGGGGGRGWVVVVGVRVGGVGQGSPNTRHATPSTG